MIDMAEPKRRRGRPAKYPKPDNQERSTARFMVSIDPELFAALEEFRKKQRFVPERSDVIADFLKRGLEKEGFHFPPKDEA